jgi:hypothetical protein
MAAYVMRQVVNYFILSDKLVLKLNQEIKKPLDNLEDIVKFLVILSQRGSQDKDLLNNAKENASSIKSFKEAL